MQQGNSFSGVVSFCPDDPLGGVSLAIGALVEAARLHFVGAMDVTTTITGATALSGLTAEALVNEAHKLVHPVRHFGLIDWRTASQRAAESDMRGVPIWLDERSGRTHDG